MNPESFDRKVAQQSAVRSLESPSDRQARRRSQGSRLSLILEMVLMIAFSLIIPPFYFLYVLWQEKAEDSKQEQSKEGPAGSKEVAVGQRRVSSRSIPMVVSPLADFSKFGIDRVANEEARFVLIAPVIYEIEDTYPVGNSVEKSFEVLHVPGHKHLRQVPAGFISDFASIPWFLGWLIQPTGRYARAAVVHDWAYSYHHDGSRNGRRDCDLAMLKLMRRDRVDPSLRALIYAGLRVGGAPAYYKAPERRDRLRTISEEMVFPLLSVQTFMLGFGLRQLEDQQFLSPIEDKVQRTAKSKGTWCDDITEAIQEQQRRFFGDILF